MSAVFIQTEAEFNENRKNEKVVAMFTASWCGPCQEIKPKFVAMPAQYTGIRFVVVSDPDDEFAENVGVESFPTFYFFTNGVRKDELTLSGANEEKLIAHVKKLQE